MKNKAVWVILGVLVILGIAIAVPFLRLGYFLLTTPPTKATILIVKDPVSLDEARSQVSFPLPDEAVNIMFAEYQEWMAYEFLLKFEAPVDACKAHARLLLKQDNRDNPDSPVSVELRPLTASPQAVPPSPPLNATWFDVENIEQGLTGGEGGSHRPTIWIDTERGLVYYLLTD